MKKSIYSILCAAGIFFSSVFSGCNNGLLRENQVGKRLDNLIFENKELTKEKKYALLINASWWPSHKENIRQAYKSLRDSDYLDKDIFILSESSLRKDDKLSINARATLNNLEEVFRYLKNISDLDDTLLVYMTGHGGKRDKDRFLSLSGAQIFNSELRNLIQQVKAKNYIFVSDQCYSGAIAEELSKLNGNVIAFSHVGADNISSSEHFGKPFWQCFRNGKADKNKDGKTTLGEAFEYASEIHSKNLGIFERLVGAKSNPQKYISGNPRDSLK